MNAPVRWDPDRYLTFAGPRLRPAMDLLFQVQLTQPARIYDLGCGTGHVTRILAEHWPKARVFGIDSSDDMLDRARDSAENSITWQHADLSDWTAPEPADLLYSNAVMHWLPDHEALFPRLMAQLAPGGVLAVQMPLSWHAPSHRLMREILQDGDAGRPIGQQSLRDRLARPPVMQPEEYYALLAPMAARVDIWKTDYLHVLDGNDPVLSWVTGTGLRPILEALSTAERERFLGEYRRRLAGAYPRTAAGTTMYRFPRLFIIASR